MFTAYRYLRGPPCRVGIGGGMGRLIWLFWVVRDDLMGEGMLYAGVQLFCQPHSHATRIRRKPRAEPRQALQMAQQPAGP